jgi:trimeric autotransporter adhesin
MTRGFVAGCLIGFTAALSACGGGSSVSGTLHAVGAPATHARLRAPEALAFDAKGNLYVSEFEGNRIDKVTPGGTLTVLAGVGTAGLSGDGGSAIKAELNAPTGILVAPDGRVFVADHHNNRIRIVDRKGIITALPGSVAADLSDPIGLALADDGSVYVADELNGRVVRIGPAGNAVNVAGGADASLHPGDGRPATKAALRHPSYLVLDAAGSVIFSDFLDNRIRRVDENGVITTIGGTGSAGFSGDGGPATAAKLDFPTGLAIDGKGDLYLSDANNNCVRRIDLAGVITTVAGIGEAGLGGDGGPAKAAELNAPSGLAFDGAGNLYIADQGNNRVRRIASDGVITTVAGRG